MAIRKLNIKGSTYYFYNDLINIKNFNNNNNLKLDKKGVLCNDVYYIGYITKKPQWNVFFPRITIIIRSVTQKDGKYYPQLFLDGCLYEV